NSGRLFNLAQGRHAAASRFAPSLAHRDYRMMWFGHVAGESASWAIAATEGWLIFNLAESNPSSWVGSVFLVAMLPWFIVPVIAGYLADRFDRRNVLTLAYVVSLLHCLVLGLLILTGSIQIWHVLLLALINGCARAVHMGAIEALAANLVPGKALPNAYALVNAGYYATRLTGPGVIAPLLGVIGLEWIFLACAFFYGIGVFFVLQIRARSTGVVEPERGLIYNALSGFKYVYGHRVLRSVIFLVMFHCTLVMSFESLLPAISDDRLDAGGGGVAYMHMMVGLGALVVSVAMAPIRGEGSIGRFFLATAIFSSVGNIVLAIAPTLPVAILGTVVIGIAHTGFMTMATIMIQSLAPDALRGRITSIYLIHAGGIMAFSYFINGVLADTFDPGWILMVGGVAFLTIVLASVFVPTPRRLFHAGVPAPVGTVSS
ncbi:MAG: MFS transporter, partial [SAR202 cluster bacterium]|nr:MFS transporter [SAR202 cluster bacterium]